MAGPRAEHGPATAHGTLLHQECRFSHLWELLIKKRFDLPLIGVKIKSTACPESGETQACGFLAME